MIDHDLDEKLARYAAKGYIHLEKAVGDDLGQEDLFELAHDGKEEYAYALQIVLIRNFFRKKGKELNSESRYKEIVEGLEGSPIGDKAIPLASVYFNALYHLRTVEERKSMINDITQDMRREVPYAGEVYSRFVKRQPNPLRI